MDSIRYADWFYCYRQVILKSVFQKKIITMESGYKRYMMKSKTCCISSFILALVLGWQPGFAYTYDGDDSDTMWGTTVYSDEPVVLAENSNYKGYNYGFPSHRRGAGVPVFIFNPRALAWAFYDSNGNLLKIGKASGGSNYCHDLQQNCHTPTGTFRVYLKQGANCKSKLFPLGKGGAPMPYCSYFYDGYAVHGSYDVRNYNASHGCIRIYPSDAKWLQSMMPLGSIVIVMPY
jgi:hypothetical protein